MRVTTRRLVLAAAGGGLLVLGIISGYNMIRTSPPYFFAALIFLGVGTIAILSAFHKK